jgi:hypothetical protein
MLPGNGSPAGDMLGVAEILCAGRLSLAGGTPTAGAWPAR